MAEPEELAPRSAWFHWRRPEANEGIGYGPATREGWLATGVFVLLVSLTVSLVANAGLAVQMSVALGAVAVAAELAGFIWFIDRHSDRPPDRRP